MARSLDASGWRTALVAEPLFALVSGRIALTVTGAQTGNPRVERVERLERVAQPQDPPSP
jgi:hypothetical protein